MDGRSLLFCPVPIADSPLPSSLSCRQPLLSVLQVWEKTLQEELDFRIEAKNMIDAQQDMQQAGFGTRIPEPVRGYIHQKVLVTTRLRGFKVSSPLSSTSLFDLTTLRSLISSRWHFIVLTSLHSSVALLTRLPIRC
jgi:predicted unusual protein kinase regulating ubiquinone biosynthesis (AarF/ABC1/UbiB family)